MKQLTYLLLFCGFVQAQSISENQIKEQYMNCMQHEDFKCAQTLMSVMLSDFPNDKIKMENNRLQFYQITMYPNSADYIALISLAENFSKQLTEVTSPTRQEELKYMRSTLIYYALFYKRYREVDCTTLNKLRQMALSDYKQVKSKYSEVGKRIPFLEKELKPFAAFEN